MKNGAEEWCRIYLNKNGAGFIGRMVPDLFYPQRSSPRRRKNGAGFILSTKIQPQKGFDFLAHVTSSLSQGVYRIGEVYARSWWLAGTFAVIFVPKNAMS